MVIGHGLLGKQFSSYEDSVDYLIFCSGVSNSTCTNIHEFQREHDLLKNAIQKYPNYQLVYFSTCSVYDASQLERPYVQHKLNMERLIQEEHANYLIVRTSNLVGKTHNPNTVLNFFYEAIQHQKNFSLWAHAERNLIDVNDVFNVVDYVLQHHLFKNQVIAVANTQSYPVRDIVSALERFTNKKARYSLEDKGQSFHIPLDVVNDIYKTMGLVFDEHYLPNLLERYYAA